MCSLKRLVARASLFPYRGLSLRLVQCSLSLSSPKTRKVLTVSQPWRTKSSTFQTLHLFTWSQLSSPWSPPNPWSPLLGTPRRTLAHTYTKRHTLANHGKCLAYNTIASPFYVTIKICRASEHFSMAWCILANHDARS